MRAVWHKSVSIKAFLMAVLFFIISSCVAVYLLFDSQKPAEYEYLFLLPLSYGLISLMFCDLFGVTQNMGIYAIIYLEFFRLVLIPLFLSLGDYYSVMKYVRAAHMTPAIALMIYEAFCVFLVVDLTHQKDVFFATKNRPRLRKNTLKNILYVLTLFLIVVAVAFPGSITAFKTIFDFGSTDFTTWSNLSISERHDVGTLGRILGTLFTMVFTWARYLLPIALIVWCKKRIKNELGAIVIALMSVMLQMMFITATIMDGILCGFVILLVLGRVYPRQRKMLIGMSVFLFALVIGFYFLSRFIVKTGGNGNAWQYISENAIAYVGGIDNVAAAMNLPDEGRWSTFFFNLYGAIPFNSTLFGLKGDKLAAVFNAVNGRGDGHIPPTIGVGWYYYGAILAPLESVIFARLASMFGSKAAAEKNIWKYTTYTLIAIMMAMGFTTYNAAIVLNYATTLLLPLLILCRYTNDLDFVMFDK